MCEAICEEMMHSHPGPERCPVCLADRCGVGMAFILEVCDRLLQFR